MTNFVTDESVEKALDWLRSNAIAASRAKAERVYLEAFTKHLIAKIMKEHPSLPVSGQEREAYADARYLTHIEGLKVAVENDSRMQFLRSAAEAKLEAWRTLHATERAMKL